MLPEGKNLEVIHILDFTLPHPILFLPVHGIGYSFQLFEKKGIEFGETREKFTPCHPVEREKEINYYHLFLLI